METNFDLFAEKYPCAELPNDTQLINLSTLKQEKRVLKQICCHFQMRYHQKLKPVLPFHL